VVKTEYVKGDEGLSIIQKYDIVKNTTGAWKLLNYHQLEITLENQKMVYEIEYLSDRFMRWKIIP
jgi:uncharacterized protein YpmB